LKLELGKQYLNRDGKKVLIVCQDIENNSFTGKVQEFTGNPYFAYSSDGYALGGAARYNIIKEYKEPVVHKRDMIFYKSIVTGQITTVDMPVGRDYFNRNSNFKEVYRHTVEYVEK